MNNLRLKTVALIERALNGTLEIDESSRFLSSLGKDADHDVAEAAHSVVHFLTDVDIRQSDEEYDLVLRAELEKYVEKLRN